MSKGKDNNVSFHHVAFSVTDMQCTEDFYKWFGFICFKRWVAEDDSLEIRHLSNKDKLVLELFAYKKNVAREKKCQTLEYDLSRVGIKHMAFKVTDINSYKEELIKQGIIASKDITVKKGRTDILYFFIQDPDGNFIEIVQDDRYY